MKKCQIFLLILGVAIISFICSACSHTFTVKNLNTYRTLGLGYAEGPVRIGLTTDTTQPVKSEYVRSICRALQNYGCASRVLFPYNLSLHRSDPKADIIVNISPSINYSGSGWNFLINFPGFLIFTPAWNGYVYHADMDFRITLSDGRTNKLIDNFVVPIKYNLRHAATNRTWTGVGWLEVGNIPFIGGLAFIRYDDNVTELLLQKVKDDVGNYVAEKIASKVGVYVASGGGGMEWEKAYEPPTRQYYTSSSNASRHRSGTLGRYYAVCIGLSEFLDPEIPALPFGAKDAEDVSTVLQNRGGIRKDCMRLLTDAEATKTNIEAALEGFLSKAGPNDVIILYWSGHGFPEPDNPKNVYFACYDTYLRKPFTGYRMDKVRQSLKEKGSAATLVIADTCHAGNIVTRGLEVGAREIGIMPAINEMKSSQTVPEGMAFLAGADTDRKAVEISSWSNGAFTHIMLKGLNGAADGFEGSGPKDGTVTFGELKTFMATELPSETERILGKAIRPVVAVTSGSQNINSLPLAK